MKLFRKSAQTYESSRQVNDSPIRTSLMVLMGVGVVVVGLSLPYYLYDFQAFYPQVLAEAHGMIFDIAIIGILIYWLNYRLEKRQRIRTYLDEIDDFRLWESEESAFRTAGNIKRLNRHKIYDLNLADSHIMRTNLNYVRLVQANLNLANFSQSLMIGAVLEESRLNQTNFEGTNLNRASFRNAFANGANFKDAHLISADFESAYLIKANFENAILMEANLRGSDLSGASLKNCNLFKADLRQVAGLTKEQLIEAQNIHRAKIDEHLLSEIQTDYPQLITR
ncbi:MAG: pentapeptide repeat-containing protein [Bacteroidia bacterium]|nr:pentapeptide repeat-containing protein [Bacteroidia bacterium]